jgi:hypothetical protein
MHNTHSTGDLERRSMAAIEESLKRGHSVWSTTPNVRAAAAML